MNPVDTSRARVGGGKANSGKNSSWRETLGLVLFLFAGQAALEKVEKGALNCFSFNEAADQNQWTIRKLLGEYNKST